MSRHRRHTFARWTVHVEEGGEGTRPAIHIDYAGRRFASVFPTHATGPGLQVCSARLDFTRGAMYDPDEHGLTAWVALAAGHFEDAAPPMPTPWIAFGCKPE